MVGCRISSIKLLKAVKCWISKKHHFLLSIIYSIYHVHYYDTGKNWHPDFQTKVGHTQRQYQVQRSKSFSSQPSFQGNYLLPVSYYNGVGDFKRVATATSICMSNSITSSSLRDSFGFTQEGLPQVFGFTQEGLAKVQPVRSSSRSCREGLGQSNWE